METILVTISVRIPKELLSKLDEHIVEQSKMFGWDRSEYLKGLVINDLKRVGKID